MNPTLATILDVLAIALLLFGLFFMSVGALGLVRLPDFYHRMHAATKCVTLGIAGLLIGAGILFATHEGASPLNVVIIITLVIAFQFIASPVGGHLLSKAAHLDGCPYWSKTLTDELGEDSEQVNHPDRQKV